MQPYRFEEKRFVIEDYDLQKPFASFLPGVSGLEGIPLWVYYTNRGQGIAGFGLENKNGAMLDFVPANVAYRRTELQGFRTFIKLDDKVHEIFSTTSEDRLSRKMLIEANSLSFEEINHSMGLSIRVQYATASNQVYPGLVRVLTIENLDSKPKDLEIVDGLMTFWPYHNDDFVIKTMSNLAVAWFEAYNMERGIPLLRNRASTEDTAAINTLEAGHFYAAYQRGIGEPLPVIIDPTLLFGTQTSLLRPVNFINESLETLLEAPQATSNQLPCAFYGSRHTLTSPLTLASLFGRARSQEQLTRITSDLSADALVALVNQATELMSSLLEDVRTQTAYPIYDAYIEQSYLDNFLRGGYPIAFTGKEGPMVHHVYSRIHGDMEREYNDFYLEPGYYSQGKGNFRDVNQNRRSDVYFLPEAGGHNLRQFMALIQLDGHNPLVIEGGTFSVEDLSQVGLQALVVGEVSPVEDLLRRPFTPGSLLGAIEVSGIQLKVTKSEFLTRVLAAATQELDASYGHGYWIDHWTYNLDLVENYLNIFPEDFETLLFKRQYRYFQSPVTVLPRRSKCVLTASGEVRQYDALQNISREGKWAAFEDGQFITSNLAVKLLVLIVNKITELDPSGIGLMMNTDKPGWNDAMNGLPGLFGSSTSEVVELKRLILFLQGALKDREISLELPLAFANFYDRYRQHLFSLDHQATYSYKLWDAIQEVKEEYVTTLESPLQAKWRSYSSSSIEETLKKMLLLVDAAILRAKQLGKGLLAAYLVHEPVAYTLCEGERHPINGLQVVAFKGWKPRVLPLFLEPIARYLKQVKDFQEARDLYLRVRDSDLYDKALKMYVTSEPLDLEGLEIGRARAFTPGWLERESVFMHMSFKYLLGLLKAGLYEEYYEAIETSLPPFMDPVRYGRSTLENSSFIVSSRNPDVKNHGRGFVSRLTGTTSEMLSMWIHQMTGSKIFTDEGELTFSLKPILRSDFFNDKGQVSFVLFRHMKVTYKNPRGLNTYGVDGVKPITYALDYYSGKHLVLESVCGDVAREVRQGEVKRIVVELG